MIEEPGRVPGWTAAVPLLEIKDSIPATGFLMNYTLQSLNRGELI